MITEPITKFTHLCHLDNAISVVHDFPKLQIVSVKGFCLKLPSHLLFILEKRSCILAWCNENGIWIFNIHHVFCSAWVNKGDRTVCFQSSIKICCNIQHLYKHIFWVELYLLGRIIFFFQHKYKSYTGGNMETGSLLRNFEHG